MNKEKTNGIFLLIITQLAFKINSDKPKPITKLNSSTMKDKLSQLNNNNNENEYNNEKKKPVLVIKKDGGGSLRFDGAQQIQEIKEKNENDMKGFMKHDFFSKEKIDSVKEIEVSKDDYKLLETVNLAQLEREVAELEKKWNDHNTKVEKQCFCRNNYQIGRVWIPITVGRFCVEKNVKKQKRPWSSQTKISNFSIV